MAYFSELSLKHLKDPNGNRVKLPDYVLPNSEASNLKGLAIINLFVGPNNSGKSIFLRKLFFNTEMQCSFPGIQMSELANLVSEFRDLLFTTLSRCSGFDFSKRDYFFGKFEAMRALDLQIKSDLFPMGDYRFISEVISELQILIRESRRLDDILREFFIHYPRSDGEKQDIKQILENFCDRLRRYQDKLPTLGDLPKSRIYIPILRGLRSSTETKNFAEVTRTEYFSELPNDFSHLSQRFIFNGFAIHERLKSDLLSSSNSRKKVIQYEDFLSRQFFDGRIIQLCPDEKSNTLHIKIGDDPDLPIYNLGDGMQSIIMLTYSAYFSDRPISLFIEEPEIYLHPGLQRRLIEVILEEPLLNRHQWFFTSHSNHLLDLTLDYQKISVFKVSRVDSNFTIERMCSPDFNLLRSIGVRGSSIFRTNSIIWVEGITDRLYLRAFFKKYISKIPKFNHLREDTHYSFVELGGNNMVHFNFSDIQNENIFVKRIIEHSYLLVDGDNLDKGTRVEEIQKEFSPDRFTILGQKEIENLLPESAVKHCVKGILERSRREDKAQILLKVDDIKFTDYSVKDLAIGLYLDKTLGIYDET